MKKVFLLLLVVSFARITLAADYAAISGIRFSSSKGYVGSPVTITVDASGPDLYYKYWASTVDYCEGSPHWIILRDWTTTNSNTWIPTAPGFYTLVVWVSSNLGVSCSNQIGAGFTVAADPGCSVAIHPPSSCAGIILGAPFSSVVSLYGLPDWTEPDEEYWVTLFYYDSLGIGGIVIDSDYDELLDNSEPVYSVTIYAPYEGKTSQCNGIGSNKNAIVAELGFADASEEDPDSNGILEYYDRDQVYFLYDRRGEAVNITVYQASPLFLLHTITP